MTTNRISFSFFFLLLCACASTASAQWIWDQGQLKKIKSQLKNDNYAPAYRKLLSEAEGDLSKKPYSVTYKAGVAPSGDKHDYVSLSRYWWPNPDTPDRLPYIYKDGQSNPELNQYDRNTLGNMARSVSTLSLAYYYSGQEKYADKAVQFLRAWFLNPETRMNPHLEYAQFIPGRNNSKGRPEGLIDSYSYVEMLNSVPLLKGSKAYTRADEQGIKDWFKTFAAWFISSEQGIKEDAAKNNHATSYDSQLIHFYLFADDEAAARAVIQRFPERRMFKQLEPDGTQPNELWRTLGYHYSLYNLAHMMDVGAVAKHLGLQLLTKEQDGRSYFKAVDYLASFLGKPLSAWPHQQISGWEVKQQELCLNLVRLISLYPERRTHYLPLIQQHGKLEQDGRWKLLWGVL
jgi:unsaturated chondroitin disaccharide hydrolase